MESTYNIVAKTNSKEALGKRGISDAETHRYASPSSLVAFLN